MQVRWAPDDLDGNLNFYSVSADGRVSHWTLVKTSLTVANLLSISFSRPLVNTTEEATAESLKDGGQAIAFKPDDDSKYLVGTDLGKVLADPV